MSRRLAAPNLSPYSGRLTKFLAGKSGTYDENFYDVVDLFYRWGHSKYPKMGNEVLHDIANDRNARRQYESNFKVWSQIETTWAGWTYKEKYILVAAAEAIGIASIAHQNHNPKGQHSMHSMYLWLVRNAVQAARMARSIGDQFQNDPSPLEPSVRELASVAVGIFNATIITNRQEAISFARAYAKSLDRIIKKRKAKFPWTLITHLAKLSQRSSAVWPPPEGEIKAVKRLVSSTRKRSTGPVRDQWVKNWDLLRSVSGLSDPARSAAIEAAAKSYLSR